MEIQNNRTFEIQYNKDNYKMNTISSYKLGLTVLTSRKPNCSTILKVFSSTRALAAISQRRLQAATPLKNRTHTG